MRIELKARRPADTLLLWSLTALGALLVLMGSTLHGVLAQAFVAGGLLLGCSAFGVLQHSRLSARLLVAALALGLAASCYGVYRAATLGFVLRPPPAVTGPSRADLRQVDQSMQRGMHEAAQAVGLAAGTLGVLLSAFSLRGVVRGGLARFEERGN